MKGIGGLKEKQQIIFFSKMGKAKQEEWIKELRKVYPYEKNNKIGDNKDKNAK